MLKSILLIGAAIVAAPSLAQTAKPVGDTAPGRTPITATPADTPQTTATDTVQAPVPAAPATGATPADPVQAAQQQPAGQTTPVQPQTTGETGQAVAQQPAAPAAAEQPATSGGQVASIVDSEFPTYDKDGDGKLSRAEFGAWMVALKTKSDPSTKPEAPATKTWVAGAFASADKDKSASITKNELTGYLSKGQS